MTQPSFVPIIEADQVRPPTDSQVPNIWTQSRPSEIRGASQPLRSPVSGAPDPIRDSPSSWPAGSRIGCSSPRGSPSRTPSPVHGGGHATVCPVRTGPGRVRPRASASPSGDSSEAPPTTWWRLAGRSSDRLRHHYTSQRAIADLVTEEALRLTSGRGGGTARPVEDPDQLAASLRISGPSATVAWWRGRELRNSLQSVRGCSLHPLEPGSGD